MVSPVNGSRLHSVGWLVQNAFARYARLAFPHTQQPYYDEQAAAKDVGMLNTLHLCVESADESHPDLTTDESYTLSIPGPRNEHAPHAAGGTHGGTDGGVIELHAATVYGALHGLETFSQLVRWVPGTGRYVIKSAPWKIDDAPRFPYRGLMIDSARHFLPLPTIRAVLDSMPYAKLNTLHWHMSDHESFPMESKTYPKLWCVRRLFFFFSYSWSRPPQPSCSNYYHRVTKGMVRSRTTNGIRCTTYARQSSTHACEASG